MTEAEVILKIALYYIKNDLTSENVKVSIDGAHIQTSGQLHFNINSFMQKNNCYKNDDAESRWQGFWKVNGYTPQIEISSVPGIGDVNILLPSKELLWFECKKGKADKRGQEYPLMREAIGQLMTNEYIPDNAIPIVAVPYTEKSFNLATKWSQLKQIKISNIRFILVKENGELLSV